MFVSVYCFAFFIRSTSIIFRKPSLSAVSNIFLLPMDKMEMALLCSVDICVLYSLWEFKWGIRCLRRTSRCSMLFHLFFGAVLSARDSFIYSTSLSGRFVFIKTYSYKHWHYLHHIHASNSLNVESIHKLNDLLASPLTLDFKNIETTMGGKFEFIVGIASSSRWALLEIKLALNQ